LVVAAKDDLNMNSSCSCCVEPVTQCRTPELLSVMAKCLRKWCAVGTPWLQHHKSIPYCRRQRSMTARKARLKVEELRRTVCLPASYPSGSKRSGRCLVAHVSENPSNVERSLYQKKPKNDDSSGGGGENTRKPLH